MSLRDSTFPNESNANATYFYTPTKLKSDNFSMDWRHIRAPGPIAESEIRIKIVRH